MILSLDRSTQLTMFGANRLDIEFHGKYQIFQKPPKHLGAKGNFGVQPSQSTLLGYTPAARPNLAGFTRPWRALRGSCRVAAIHANFRSARKALLKSALITDEEKQRLSSVNLRIHANDSMYFMPDAVHYLAVGLSACRCITTSLQHLGINSINDVLYLPSGYGRELRFAQLLLPHSTIIASDIDRTGLNFCHKEFGVKTVLSNDSFSVPHLDGQFDLIWCGSLITHLNEASAVRLLELFYSLLAPGGLCLFSTHGTMHAHWIEKRSQTYGLSEAGQRDLLKQFGDGGYGYANYLGLRNYGISVVSYSKMVSLAKTVGTWSEVIYLERGWHNSHDVFGFSNRDRTIDLARPSH